MTVSAVKPFAAAGDGEAGVEGAGDVVAAVGAAVREVELDDAVTVDPHDAGEVGFRGDRIDVLPQSQGLPPLEQDDRDLPIGLGLVVGERRALAPSAPTRSPRARRPS